jgi:hypothetical protein
VDKNRIAKISLHFEMVARYVFIMTYYFNPNCPFNERNFDNMMNAARDCGQNLRHSLLRTGGLAADAAEHAANLDAPVHPIKRRLINGNTIATICLYFQVVISGVVLLRYIVGPDFLLNTCNHRVTAERPGKSIQRFQSENCVANRTNAALPTLPPTCSRRPI